MREPLGDVNYWYRRGGRRVYKTVHFFLFDYVSGSTDDHDHEVEEARWIPLAEARTALSYPGERALIERALSKSTPGPLGCRAVQVLNFYSTVFADQMKRGRKTATIRLGDKRHKYRKNQVVLVTVGYQYSPREKLFHAVIDNVEVKRVKDLSPRDIEHDNPEFRRTEEMVHFLEQIYGREVVARRHRHRRALLADRREPAGLPGPPARRRRRAELTAGSSRPAGLPMCLSPTGEVRHRDEEKSIHRRACGGGGHTLPARRGTGVAYSDEVLADHPLMYLRMGEAKGTTVATTRPPTTATVTMRATSRSVRPARSPMPGTRSG